MPRKARDMFEKYPLKYDGENVTTKLTAVKPLMELRYEAASSVIDTAVEAARSILSAKGVPTGQWAIYIAFAEILASKTLKHKGATLDAEASGLKQYFVTAHGADPAILDEIITAIIGAVPAY